MKADTRKGTSVLGTVKQILAMNLAICGGLMALTLAFSTSPSWHGAWRVFGANLVYSNCIGFLAAFSIPPVAIRLSRFGPWARWPPYIGLLVIVGVAGALLANGILLLLSFFPPDQFAVRVRGSTQIAVLLTVMIGTAVYIIEEIKERAEQTTLELRTKQLEHERALKLATSARLDSLESRLKPHFLFNTINSILSLMREDPQSGEVMLERLSRLLRFSLDSQHEGVVPLSEELHLVEDYLAIERARFGDRLTFEVDAPERADLMEIPPYAIQTLVENSMKYAIAPRREGGQIRISIRRSNSTLEIAVQDDGPGFTREAMMPGHGLDTLEKRLETLYGGRAVLAIENGTGGSVRLTIPEGAEA